jgi:hypothetical protein
MSRLWQNFCLTAFTATRTLARASAAGSRRHAALFALIVLRGKVHFFAFEMLEKQFYFE